MPSLAAARAHAPLLMPSSGSWLPSGSSARGEGPRRFGMTLGCSGGALVPAHRLKLALDFPIQVAASREKSFTGYSAAFLRSKRAARAEAGATVEVTVEATVAAAVVETARRKSTRKQVVCAMLRTANLEESDRRRAVRACAPLHENDSDTHSDVAHRPPPQPPPCAARLRPSARRAAAGAARRFLYGLSLPW